MRPIRRFGTSNLISDRLTTKSHDKINTLSRPSWTSSALDDDRRKLRSLFYANNYVSSYSSSSLDKENRRTEDTTPLGPPPSQNGMANGDKPEVIINTPAFQLVCDRRRAHARHASADDAIVIVHSPTDEKPPKSAMKKSPGSDGIMSSHRSRWASFTRRSVSFADDKGLKLAEIRLIEMNGVNDHRDYRDYDLSSSIASLRNQASGFIADFILPPSYRRLRALQASDATSPPVASSQIVLESYTSSRWSVTGVIAVRSNADVSGQKRVFVRYTNDQWTTSIDNDATLATPETGVRDSVIERYSFTLPFPLRPQTGSRLEFKFGVRMPAGVGGVLSPITYWDDNHGSNYSFTFV